jgi:hypothetical protein
VVEAALPRREHPELYKRLKKGRHGSALRWERDGDKLLRLEGV